MKPLELEFSGLNSYRGRQYVDFELLGEGGLFGIFGPTGSGKSTILDAITLALYGKVDRAENNTRGIINQREKTAEVSFTFTLGGHRYTVQRSYQRPKSDPNSARAKTARLIEADDSVLADKPDTVTEAIERILGLTAEEFCRAVVLPQGKFSEFLTLTGGKRADMLGHIFNLERFGEALYRAATDRLQKWQQESDAFERAKSELGDCSDAAIAQAQAAVQDRNSVLQQTEAQRNDAKKGYDEAARLRDLFENLRSAQKLRVSLLKQKDCMDRDARALDAARRAASLRSSIETVARLKRSRDDSVQKLTLTSANLKKAQAARNIAEENARVARECLQHNEPLLVVRKHRLEDALALGQELEGYLKKQKEKETSTESFDLALEKGRRSALALEERLSRSSAEVGELTSRQKELAVDPAFRKNMDGATGKLAAFQIADKEYLRSSKEYEKRSADSSRARSEVLALFLKLPSIAASKHSLADSGSLSSASSVELPALDDLLTGDDFLTAVDREIDHASTLIRAADEMRQEALIKDQAKVLAKELRDGHPCPVCGSTSHPNVAAGDDGRYSRLAATQKTLDSCLKSLQSYRSKLQTCVSAWDNRKASETEAQEQSKQRQADLEDYLGQFLAAAKVVLGGKCSEKTAQADIQQEREKLVERDQNYATVTDKLLTAQSEEQNTRKELDEERRRFQGLEKNRDAEAKELELVRSHAEEINAKILSRANGEDPSQAIAAVDFELKSMRDHLKQTESLEKSERQTTERLEHEVAGLTASLSQVVSELEQQDAIIAQGLSQAGFDTPESAQAAMLPLETINELDRVITKYSKDLAEADGHIRQLETQTGSREFSETEFVALGARLAELETAATVMREEYAVAQERLRILKERRSRWDELDSKLAIARKSRDVADRLALLVRGRALVKFLSEEHLKDMAMDASARLGSLTQQRYALEIANESEFVIRDDFNGGQRRVVGTLSGGETFLTSLSLALALSSKIQLRGQYPLGFFFLDEGFGSLDDDKLETVMSSLDRLHDKDRRVGVISHVKALRDRLPYYLEVAPSREDGTGSQVSLKKG